MHPDELIAQFATFLKPHDLVLVKGSQGMRMERLVKVILAEETDAQLLPRQDHEWQKRLPK